MDTPSGNNIERLGFDEHAYSGELEKASEFVLARVIAVHKDRSTISDGVHEVLAEMSGRKVDFQLIAANLDTAFIMQALDVDYSLSRLECCRVMIPEGHVHPVVL